MPKALRRSLPYVPLLIWAVVILFPLYWMVITSFKLPIDINRGVSYVPWVDFSPSLHAWQDLMHGAVPVAEPLRNSFIAATTSSLAAVVLGGMAGYGLSRFQYRWGPWRNGDIAFWFISQRVPPAAAILAFMVMFNYLHLLDSVVGLAIAYTGFNCRSPSGSCGTSSPPCPEGWKNRHWSRASWLSTFWRIVLPLSVPGLAAAASFFSSSPGTNTSCSPPWHSKRRRRCR